MSKVALWALAVLLSGCTATFIGDRAYRSPPKDPPARPEIAFGRRLGDVKTVETAEPEHVVFTEPVDATKQRFHELSPRRAVEGRERPRVFASLPSVRLRPPALSADGPRWPGGGVSWFSLKQADNKTSLRVFPDLTAEVMVGEARFFTAGPVRGAEAAAPASWLKVKACDSNQAASKVRWNGFLSRTRTEQSLTYLEMSGLLSPKSCRAEASEVRSVNAVALLPGVIYAARRCADAECLGAGPQSIILIAPPAKWMPSTTDHPSDLLVPHTGSFSRAEVAIRKGGAGSAVFTVEAEHIAKFRRVPNPSSFIGVRTIQISVDVIWPSTADEPTFSVRLAAVDPPVETFAELTQRERQDRRRPVYEYSFSDDLLKPDSFSDPRAPVAKGRR